MVNNLNLDYYKKYGKQTNNQKQYKKQREIIKLSEQYSKQYNSQILYFDILVNSDRADVVYKYKDVDPIKCVVDYNKKWTKNIDDPLARELWSKHNVLQVGEIIDFESKVSKEKKTYILTRQVENDQGYDVFQMEETTHTLKWLNSKRDICSSPAIIEKATKTSSDGIYENSKIKVGDTIISVTFPSNDDTNQIQIGKRFLLDKTHAYEISDTGVTSPKGLRQMILTQTEIHQGVDKLDDDLLIADYYGNAHEYSIETLNKSIVLTKNSTYKLQVNVLDKGVKIDNPELIFDVVDKDIITITGDTITGLKEGNTSIIARFKDITDTINIEVVAAQNNNYTCVIEGSETMALNRSKTYVAKFFNNGLEINETGIWSITDENGNSTDYASIVSSTSNTCLVKTTSKWIFSGNESKYFWIHCKGSNAESVKKVKITTY